ncbi:MAG: phenylalanine--tRNA ligase subunit alpha [Candidatus Bathyarchaeota archaeon]|nr:phenylalanine--tRNA ligase subunit alpha [Candidatus Bathyarchaeota archaeon]MDH5623929.1 phenylalanine--tRNA ligase subunit alpha [Candidatus Bathyarchaeota archaeon]MDH5701171.1 phenylalanine--tRNA ligase subunit alpha [Candidatus Bathyarchaeota archaeon]
MAELRENEQKTLLALERLRGRGPVDQLVKVSGLAHAAVMRAALSLTTKKLVRTHERKQTAIALTKEGSYHAKKRLPERRLINSLIKLGGEASVDDVADAAGLEKKFLTIALGWLSRKDWATIKKKERVLKSLREPLTGNDEKLLSLLAEKEPLIVEDLSQELQKAVSLLKKRRLVKVSKKTLRELELTDAGWDLAEKGIEIVEEVSQLTPELIRTGRWRKAKLRRFDVTAPGPIIHPGKIHPAQQIIQRVREIFLEMGFTEIRGSIVETAFWNFDALFQPQDHPAREMMDTFYLAQPRKGKLPKKDVVDAVAKTHEDGWITGSRGWEYTWSADEAKRLILRTHTTAVTIRYLAEHKEPPVKVFSVDRVYRNEKVDYKHLAEFHQIEGIVMDKKVTLRDLMGTLKEFYLKLGLKKVQFWPSYFPYTEPSMQSTVYVPELKTWVELCGMGIFRPEVLAPLGIKYPVLAWGGGLERLIILKLGIEDIRLLYKNDLGWMRRTPVCQR